MGMRNDRGCSLEAFILMGQDSGNQRVAKGLHRYHLYASPYFLYSVLGKSTRYKREPISFTVALLLGGITVGGIAAGIGN
ncbi:Envelope glycoprotein [Cricetulus griseus]|uniref:Envelope glycoprotein n=1 Tax=Cricetulus griseus TaxID=10029 RepID=G3GYG6_CRIGR|nr:Envelope glycoprotein [Cricetulus griseus]